MHRPLRLRVLGLATLFVAGCAPTVRPAKARPLLPGTTQTLQGRLLRENGEPIAQAVIIASSPKSAWRFYARTDEGGWFRLDVPRGTYQITAKIPTSSSIDVIHRDWITLDGSTAAWCGGRIQGGVWLDAPTLCQKSVYSDTPPSDRLSADDISHLPAPR